MLIWRRLANHELHNTVIFKGLFVGLCRNSGVSGAQACIQSFFSCDNWHRPLLVRKNYAHLVHLVHYFEPGPHLLLSVIFIVSSIREDALQLKKKKKKGKNHHSKCSPMVLIYSYFYRQTLQHGFCKMYEYAKLVFWLPLAKGQCMSFGQQSTCRKGHETQLCCDKKHNDLFLTFVMPQH